MSPSYWSWPSAAPGPDKGPLKPIFISALAGAAIIDSDPAKPAINILHFMVVSWKLKLLVVLGLKLMMLTELIPVRRQSRQSPPCTACRCDCSMNGWFRAAQVHRPRSCEPRLHPSPPRFHPRGRRHNRLSWYGAWLRDDRRFRAWHRHPTRPSKRTPRRASTCRCILCREETALPERPIRMAVVQG